MATLTDIIYSKRLYIKYWLKKMNIRGRKATHTETHTTGMGSEKEGFKDARILSRTLWYI